MSLSRRQIIGAGAATGALALLGSPALAAIADPRSRTNGLADLRIDELDPPHPAFTRAPAPVPAVAAAPAQLDPRMLARARAAFERHRSRLTHADVIGIADFTRASSEQRFFLMDTMSGRVTRHLVAHGRGSDPAHTGFLQHFSNRVGSEASSEGSYVTSAYYPGRYGRSMRLQGLDYSNSNAEARAIVVHSAWYAEPNVLASNSGRLGRSEGCFALPYSSLQEVLARLGPGRFLYADRLSLA
jgi:L,D-transpeptidase catalytic domain